VKDKMTHWLSTVYIHSCIKGTVWVCMFSMCSLTVSDLYLLTQHAIVAAYRSSRKCLTAMGTHMPYGITYGDIPTFMPANWFRSGFTNAGELADLLNADYLKTTAKSNSYFTKQK